MLSIYTNELFYSLIFIDPSLKNEVELINTFLSHRHLEIYYVDLKIGNLLTSFLKVNILSIVRFITVDSSSECGKSTSGCG